MTVDVAAGGASDATSAARASAAVPTVAVVTYFPSPYQVELFDSVERMRPGALTAIYLHRADPTRKWRTSAPSHRVVQLIDRGVQAEALDMVLRADVAVFNYYQDARASSLMRQRARTGRPWAFWGERPGFRHAFLGRVARRWALSPLHASAMPIWGIGSWAVDAYRSEFGPHRAYENIPYCSDLDRYRSTETAPAAAGFTFLYSGSLSQRKGVDLLAGAFARLADEAPHVRLRVMGHGPLEQGMRTRMAAHRGRVDWVGFKEWHELPTEYASSHILCAPSRHDGWALVVPEGLAAGLPVIGTNRTGAAIELIQPGFNGWMAPAGSEDALFESMRDAANLSSEAWQEMSRNARASVADRTLTRGTLQFLDAVDRAALANRS